jgi:adenylate cyclase class 2
VRNIYETSVFDGKRRQTFRLCWLPRALATLPAAPRATIALYFTVPQPPKTHAEIEIKLPVTDLRATVRAVQALGAVNHGRVFESNTLYDTPHSDLRHRGRLLRVRTESAAPGTTRIHTASVRRVVLTSKAPPRQQAPSKTKPRYKERAEREVAFWECGSLLPLVTRRGLPRRVRPGQSAKSARDWRATLRALGFQPKFRYEKFRTSFSLRGLHLDLDETPVGTFLELEGRPSAIDRVARTLGYTPDHYIRGTYWDVYASDCRRSGRPIKNMVFSAK